VTVVEDLDLPGVVVRVERKDLPASDALRHLRCSDRYRCRRYGYHVNRLLRQMGIPRHQQECAGCREGHRAAGVRVHATIGHQYRERGNWILQAGQQREEGWRRTRVNRTILCIITDLETSRLQSHDLLVCHGHQCCRWGLADDHILGEDTCPQQVVLR